jgi:chorismate mutase
MRSLRECRREVDAVDAAIVVLLEKRATLAKEALAIRKSLGRPGRDLARERQLLSAVGGMFAGVLMKSARRRIYRTVLAEMRAAQRVED